MKKRIFLLTAVLLFSVIISSCSNIELDNNQAETSTPTSARNQSSEDVLVDESEINQTFSDWILGTEYGITEVLIDHEECCAEIVISEDNYSKLQDYDFTDIYSSVNDILKAHGAENDYDVTFSNGVNLMQQSKENDMQNESIEESPESEKPTESISDFGETLNLIFIHHSVGENWLNAGLNQMLNDNKIHVADTYYGWHEMGDRTDTSDWPDWFNDDVMPTVYNELGNMTGYNDIEPAAGENTIIMFKSCYPNSDVGNSIEDEKEIYLNLLDYFSQHQDKMFVLITPPPMQRISNAKKTRELANWLVAGDGWRKDYDYSNLYVFDFYNVLTAEDNHHMLVDGVEEHIINDSSNTLHYDSSGDDHPNDDGSLKAAEEFVPLLIYWYGIFSE